MSAGRSASWTSAIAKTPSTPCSEHFLPYGVPRAHLAVQVVVGLRPPEVCPAWTGTALRAQLPPAASSMVSGIPNSARTSTHSFNGFPYVSQSLFFRVSLTDAARNGRTFDHPTCRLRPCQSLPSTSLLYLPEAFDYLLLAAFFPPCHAEPVEASRPFGYAQGDRWDNRKTCSTSECHVQRP